MDRKRRGIPVVCVVEYELRPILPKAVQRFCPRCGYLSTRLFHACSFADRDETQIRLEPCP